MNTPPPNDPFARALAVYSTREQARAIAPPPGFAARVMADVLNRPRWPWKAVAASTLALALAAVGVGYAVWPKAKPEPVPPQPVTTVTEPPPSAAPNIGDQLSEAGNALAKLTRTTAEKATPRALLPEPAKVDPPKPLSAEANPAADAIAAVPAAAKSGLEPVAGGTRRAINAFLRDTGLRPN